MVDYLSVYQPRYLPEEMVLDYELRYQGSKENFKTLSKLKKGTYPIKGSTAERSDWWTRLDKGKKNAKAAMRIMASEYDRAIERLDRSHNNKLELESTIKSQKDELKSLRLRLQEQEEENRRLILDRHKDSSHHAAQIRSLTLRLKTQEEENSSLNGEVARKDQTIFEQSEDLQRASTKVNSLSSVVEKLKDKIKKLKEEEDGQPIEFTEDSGLMVIPVNRIYRDVGMNDYLLCDLPDLQCNHSNYDFWVKIKSWFELGCRPSEILKAALQKCPLDVQAAVRNNFSESERLEADHLSSQKLLMLMKKFHKSISEALGLGTNQFPRYYFRRQHDDESFREYCEEKLRLYRSYGADKMEASQNDLHFLHNVLEKALRRYQGLLLHVPKSYNDMLQEATICDGMLMEAKGKNECFNCGRSGHTTAQCRRPGGDVEADPNQCYTCGGYSHWARDCWWHKNRG